MSIIIDDNHFGHYADSLRYYPNYVALKNKDFIYTAANEAVAQLLGFKSSNDLIGKTDFELNCGVVVDASRFRESDKATFENKKINNRLCFGDYDTGWKLLYFNGELILNQNQQFVGLLLVSNDITNFSLLNFGVILNQILANKIRKRQCFYVELVENYAQSDLTKKQAQVLFYNLHGYTAKEIAKILTISPHTVERHLEDIKLRLNCQSKSQLIEKSITMGLMNSILITSN